MKKITFLLLVLVALTTSATFAQVAINENGALPNGNSILDVKSTTKGMLIPRMLTSERTTLGSTLTITERGMLVYDWEQGAFYYFDGSGWVKLAAYGSADGDWTVSGDNMYSAVSGDVGIGKTSNFLGKLDVNGKIYVDNSSDDAIHVHLAGSPTIAPLQWWSTENNGLEINGAQGHGVYVGAADKSGLYVQNAAENGVYIASADTGLNIYDASTDGIYIKRVGTPSGNASSSYNNGVEIAGVEGSGVYVGWANRSAYYANSTGLSSFYAYSAGTPLSHNVSTDKNGFDVAGAQGNGVYVGYADENGVQVKEAIKDGIQIIKAGAPINTGHYSSYNNGLEINSTEGHGVFIGKTDKDGIFIQTAGVNGINIESVAAKGILVKSAATNGLYLESSGEDAIKIRSAGSPSTVNISSANNGIEIMGAQGNGVFVGRADAAGIYVESAATDGIYVKSAVDGVEINNAVTGVKINNASHDGIVITKAGTTSSTALPSNDNNGIEVELAEDNGVYIGQADGDGIKIAKAGNPTASLVNMVNDGLEIAGAEGNGVYVGRAYDDGVRVVYADDDGFEISEAGAKGLKIGTTGSDGIYIGSTGDDGIYISQAANYGVYANTTVTGGYGFYTDDKIYGSNLTSKSSSTYGINTGSKSLQAGDVVCIAGGMENNIDGTENLFAINLEMANQNNRQAVFGVVEYKVNIKIYVQEHKTSDNQINRTEDKSFAHTDGDVYSGDYFSVIILGPAEVVVDSKANIKVGANVCIGNNGVASQKVTEINGITIAENVGILGKSMGEASGGKMLVYVNCK